MKFIEQKFTRFKFGQKNVEQNKDNDGDDDEDVIVIDKEEKSNENNFNQQDTLNNEQLVEKDDEYLNENFENIKQPTLQDLAHSLQIQDNKPHQDIEK